MTASYRHNYNMQTGRHGQCMGWETIALPFTVQTVHQVQKDEDLVPFIDAAKTNTNIAKENIISTIFLYLNLLDIDVVIAPIIEDIAIGTTGKSNIINILVII